MKYVAFLIFDNHTAQQLEKHIKSWSVQNVWQTAGGEEIWPTWFLTNKQMDSSHAAFVDTFWFAWNSASVKPNPPKGKMQMSRNSYTESDTWTELQVSKVNTLRFHTYCCWSGLEWHWMDQILIVNINQQGEYASWDGLQCPVQWRGHLRAHEHRDA